MLEEAAWWWGDSTADRLAFLAGLLSGAMSVVFLLEPLGWWLSIAGWAIVFFIRWLGAISPDIEPSSPRQRVLDVLQRLTIGMLVGAGIGLLAVAVQRALDADGAAAVAAIAGCVAVCTTALVLAKGDQRLLGLVFFSVGIAVLLIGQAILAQLFLAFGFLASGIPQRIRAWLDEQRGNE